MKLGNERGSQRGIRGRFLEGLAEVRSSLLIQTPYPGLFLFSIW